MRRSQATLFVLLAVAALGTLFFVADPLGLLGTDRSGSEEGSDELTAGGTGPRLEGVEKPRAGRLPKDVNGEPVGTLTLTLGTAGLTGTVVGGGVPILLARVEVLLPPPFVGAAVRTKEQGAWEIRGLPAGTFELRVSADGWRSRTVAAPALVDGQSVVVPPIELQPKPALNDGIEMKVTDVEGRPIPGARVLATTIPWDLHLAIGPDLAGIRDVIHKQALTDEDGVARLVPMLPQTYSVVVSAAGRCTVSWDRLVVARGRLEKLTARLSPGVSIQGRVTDHEGAPLAGAHVMGFHQPSFMSSVMVNTGADGTFSLDGLREGRYWVMAFHDDHGRGQANPVVSPSVGTTIKLGGVGWLEGTVTDAQGKPLSGVTLRPWSNEPFGYVYSRVVAAETDGTFKTAVTPGAWTVDARAEDGSLSQGNKATVKVGEVSTLAIKVPATGVVKGVVTDSQGNAVEGAEVYVRMGGFPPGPNREQYARSDVEGRFEVKGLPIAQVKLHVKHSKYADVAWEGMPALAGAAPSLTLRMGTGARIVGRVTLADGTPQPHEQINLFQNWFEPKTTFCDADGNYVFEAVAQGTWRLSTGIFENGAPGQVKTDIVVGAEGTVTVDFGVKGGSGTLTGKVSSAGKPAAGALVRVMDKRGEAAQQTATTDATGAFKVTGLEVGELRVHVETLDGSTVVRRSEIDPETLTAAIQISFGKGSVKGRILRQDGEPIVGAWISLEMVSTEGDVWTRLKAQLTSASDGAYEAKNIEPGSFQLRVSSGEFAQHLTEVFPLADGEARDLGEIRLAQGATLSGRVTDDTGKPVEDATVSLKDSRGRQVFNFSLATTGSDGRYDVHGLAQGAYTVRFEAKGLAPDERPVQVGATGASVDGVLARGGTLAVIVEDDAGRPVAFARVIVKDAKGQIVNKTLSLVNIFDSDNAVTNEQGATALHDLAPGPYRLSATKEGLVAPAEDVSVSVVAAGSVSARITLRPPK